jgi:hypothetical protein
MNKKKAPIATDIYDRMDMTAQGVGGSVYDDLAELEDFSEMEDYFGDTDPAEWL